MIPLAVGAGKVDHVAQSEALARVIASTAYVSELRNHLADILQSPAFKVSPRSQHLLKYVVEKALDGDLDLLKERLIGIELFGRPSDYDTGEDAVVRVAASDVRKRLLQFYGTRHSNTRIRVHLPPGSYVPSFEFVDGKDDAAVRAPGDLPIEWKGRRRSIVSALCGVALVAALWIVRSLGASGSPPWSVLFSRSASQTNVVLSDANISALQFLLNFRLPLSDYANRQYLPPLEHPLSPDMQQVARGFTGIDYTAATAAIDAATVLRVSQLAGAYSSRIKVRPARSLQLRDFESEDNFILLGSPSSNPWTGMFGDQLDFTFDYDPATKKEFLRNKRPARGELERYVPTALGGATGRTFGTAGFIRNSNHGGHVLILAGTTAEATEAAVQLTTNPDTFRTVLRQYGITASAKPRHFQILLSVDEMAGAPVKSEIVAAHILPDHRSAH